MTWTSSKLITKPYFFPDPHYLTTQVLTTQEVQCLRTEAEEAETNEEKEALLKEADERTQKFSILFDSTKYQVSVQQNFVIPPSFPT